eukprot:360224-Chlamydomonas_euryale.AAC.3
MRLMGWPTLLDSASGLSDAPKFCVWLADPPGLGSHTRARCVRQTPGQSLARCGSHCQTSIPAGTRRGAASSGPVHVRVGAWALKTRACAHVGARALESTRCECRSV